MLPQDEASGTEHDLTGLSREELVPSVPIKRLEQSREAVTNGQR